MWQYLPRLCVFLCRVGLFISFIFELYGKLIIGIYVYLCS